MTNEHLQKVRERADSVLDGFAKHRDRVAQDAKELCDEVSRLHRAILGIKLQLATKEHRSGMGSSFSEAFWKDVFRG